MHNLPPKISHTETLRLVAEAQAGSIASRNAAIAGNMRLVAVVAERAAGAVGRKDLIDDLIMAGAMGVAPGDGLLHAVMHFDSSRGTHFSTFAYPYIREAVQKQLASLARDLGSYKSREKLATVRRVAAQLGSQIGRAATAVEVHTELRRRNGDMRRVSLQRVELALQRPGRATHEEPSSGGEDEELEALDARRAFERAREAALHALSCDEQALLTRRHSGGEKLAGAERKAADLAEAKLREALAPWV